MKRTFTRLTHLAVLAAVSFSLGSSALAGQPHMKAALQSLLAARGELERGTGGKGGQRVAAIRAIDRAIAEVQASLAKER